MLVLLSFVLVLVATVLLVLGLLVSDGLTLIYISIGMSALAAVLLVVAVRMSKPTATSAAAPSPLEPEPVDDLVGGGGSAAVDPGPPTQPVVRVDVTDRATAGSADEEDAYLAELRKAMLDDTGAPGLEDDERDDLTPRSRFGKRR